MGFSFPFTGGDLGDENLHKELIRKAEEQNWEIIIGGNRVYQIDIGKRKKIPIMSIAEQRDYSWGMASLSPDGQWLALARGKKRPPFKTDIVLLNWRRFRSGAKSLQDLIQLPLLDYDIEGFAWAPTKHSIAIKARKWSDENQARGRDRKYDAYEFLFDTHEMKKLPIKQISSLKANAWSVENQLVYKSVDNSLEKLDAENSGKKLPNISELALYDFNSQKITNLFSGDFPSWSPKGLLTYLDFPKEDLAVLAPPKNPDEGHQYKDSYYTYNLKTGEKQLLIKNEQPRGTNGAIFSPIVWSPDAKYILYGRQSGFTGSTDDLYVMEIATGKETLVCRGVDMLFSGHASWVAIKEK